MKRKFMVAVLILCMMISLLPVTVQAADEKRVDGWYNLRCMYNYLNIDAGGSAELRKLSQNEAFYVETVGGSEVILKMKDGRYLGIEGERKNGTRVKAVSQPYIWTIYKDNKEADVFSLRPPEAYKLVVNASGEKNIDGTHVILWTAMSDYGNPVAPNHARFRFIPVDPNTVDSTGESWVVYEEKGLYGYKDRSGKVMIKAQFDDADEFSQGIARVYSDSKTACAYIDTTGKLLTPYKYSNASDWTVNDGLIKVAVDGDEVVKAIMNGDSIDHYYGEGSNNVVVMKSGKTFKHAPKHGYINTKGKEVIPLKFDEANPFQDGLAAVYKFDGWKKGYEMYTVGWIDTTGKLVIPYKSFSPPTYAEIVHDVKDGLVRYFVNSSGDPEVSSSAGIMDKTGKVIISHNLDQVFPSSSFTLDWKDGVIAVGPYTRVNEKGVPDKNGKYEWNFPALYDYSGKLIKKLDGYVEAVPLGGGYTLALHQTFNDVVLKKDFSGYWSLFDRTGKMVLEKVEVNNFYLLGQPYGVANGYAYFGDTRYKIPVDASTSTTPGSSNQSSNQGPLLTAQESIRLSGSDRFETAVAISKNGWNTSENVVLAYSNGFAGALAGSSLAYLKDAPVLLTDTKALSDVTAKEMERLGAKTVYIIGNTDEVSQAIENQLKSKYEVVRISGSDQFNTAVKVGEEVKKFKDFDTVAIATQNNFPDTLAITPYSAKNTIPILFSGKDKLRDDTKAALQAWGIKQVVITGGTGVISQAVEDELKNMGISVTRLAGEDRYDTALAIVKHFETSPYTKITLATGLNYPDALTGAALAAKKGMPMLLISKDNVKASVKSYLDGHKLEQAYIFGGDGVIGKNILGR